MKYKRNQKVSVLVNGKPLVGLISGMVEFPDQSKNYIVVLPKGTPGSRYRFILESDITIIEE
jgi:hypothetical protein